MRLKLKMKMSTVQDILRPGSSTVPMKLRVLVTITAGKIVNVTMKTPLRAKRYRQDSP